MQGLILALTSYIIWGVSPLFFDLLSHVSAVEVLAHRVIWSLVATLGLALILRRLRWLILALKKPKLLLWLGLSSLLISINWLVYIWAVLNHHVLEASLGYFITPVVSLVLARLLLKESLHPLQAAAGALALVAVAWELWSLGSLPWVTIVLSLAFAFYGLIRKLHPVDGLNGLTIETLWVLPLAIAWIVWQDGQADSVLKFGQDVFTTSLLISSGFLTALPLVLFAIAARQVDLSVIGFIMYVNPTMQFLIGVFILDEHFPQQRLITFVLVWIALLLFIIGMLKQRQKQQAVTN